MYEFARGPLVWIAFASLGVGFLVQLFRLRKRDLGNEEGDPQTFYKWMAAWVVQRVQRGLGFAFFSVLFYLLLLATPLLLIGHRVLWMDAWGFAWPTLHAGRTHGMGLMVLALGGALLLGRIANMKTQPIRLGDLVRWLLLLAPFATGLMANDQIADTSLLLPLHILTGAIGLAALPYTALADRILFLIHRGYRFRPPGDFQSEKIW